MVVWELSGRQGGALNGRQEEWLNEAPGWIEAVAPIEALAGGVSGER